METIVTGPAATDEHAARSHGSQAAHEPAEKAGDGGDVWTRPPVAAATVTLGHDDQRASKVGRRIDPESDKRFCQE